MTVDLYFEKKYVLGPRAGETHRDSLVVDDLLINDFLETANHPRKDVDGSTFILTDIRLNLRS